MTGDPWDGRTLEWSTSSPPPAYNFAFTPVVHDNDAWCDMKQRGYERPLDGFIPIHMPRNTGAGFVLAALSAVLGFALIWHMWWLAAAAFVALIVAAIGHTFNYDRDYHIPADEVVRVEDARTRSCSARPEPTASLAPRRRLAQARSGPGASTRTRSSTASPGERHAARVLALPDERLPDLRGAVRDLRRARPQLRRRARPAPSCSTCRWSRVNTALLLLSSITYGFAMLAMQSNARSAATQLWLAITGLLGAGFLGIELYEFAASDPRGRGPQRSAFLSSFFALVGTHGLHVTFGIVWLVVLMVQVGRHGLIAANRRRLMCLSMFWHFLDVVWIGVFTFVYLMGVLR